MAYIINDLCIDNKDTACVEVCPVDCIFLPEEGNSAGLPTNQLLISPELCIDCDACLPVCPWNAITDDGEVPSTFEHAIELNARIDELDLSDEKEGEEWERPRHSNDPVTDEQLQANYEKYGYTP